MGVEVLVLANMDEQPVGAVLFDTTTMRVFGPTFTVEGDAEDLSHWLDYRHEKGLSDVRLMPDGELRAAFECWRKAPKCAGGCMEPVQDEGARCPPCLAMEDDLRE